MAVILNRLYEWSQNFITRELVELSRQGVTVYLGARQIIPREDLTAEESKLGERFISIPENPFYPNHLLRHAFFAIRNSTQYFRAWKEFFTFGHTKLSKWGRSLVCLFRAAAIADEVKKRKINLIHAQFMTAPTETALYLSALTGIPFGCTAHAMDIYVDSSGMPKKLARAAYVITVTQANVSHFKNNWRVGDDSLRQIYVSVSQSMSHSEKRPHHPFTFVAVGRLVPKKGFEYLIKACKILYYWGESFQCKVVGTGPLESKLKELSKQLHVSDVVKFEGYVAPNKMEAVYESSDVLVMSSIIDKSGDRDGLPTVCIEALSHGLPLVCTDVSGLPECVIENQNGKIVPEKDDEALAAAMVEIMRGNYEEMSAHSIRLANERFDCKKNVARIREIMQQHAVSID